MNEIQIGRYAHKYYAHISTKIQSHVFPYVYILYIQTYINATNEHGQYFQDHWEKKKLCAKRKNTEFWVKNIAYNDNKQRLFVSAVCFVSETQSFVPESADNRIYCSRCAARRYSIIELIVVTEAFQRENNAWTCLVCVFDCNNDRRCSGTYVLLVHLRQWRLTRGSNSFLIPDTYILHWYVCIHRPHRVRWISGVCWWVYHCFHHHHLRQWLFRALDIRRRLPIHLRIHLRIPLPIHRLCILHQHSPHRLCTRASSRFS